MAKLPGPEKLMVTGAILSMPIGIGGIYLSLKEFGANSVVPYAVGTATVVAILGFGFGGAYIYSRRR